MFQRKTVFSIFLVLGFLFFFPYIFNGFNYDDFFWVSVLEEKIPYRPLVGFWDVDALQFPAFQSMWWTDAAEDVGRFLRPLFSWTFAFFFGIFGRDAHVPLHILSIFLHTLIAYTTFLLLLKLSKNYAVSLLAGFLFLICEDHSMTVGWISTSTDLIAVLFMNLSLYFHFTYRETGKKVQFLYSNLFLLLAFFGKETAIVTPFAIMLYEFLFSKNASEPHPGFSKWIVNFLNQWKYWGLSFSFGVLFLLIYKLFGFGTHNLAYYDPFRQPWEFLSNLVIGYPILFAGYLSVIPIGLTLFIKEAVLPVALIGGVLFLFFLITLIPYRKNKVLWYCLVLFLVSILPQLSTDASERQLYFPYVAGSYLVSYLIVQLKFLKARHSPDSPPAIRYLGSLTGYYLLFSSLVLGLLLTIYYPYSYQKSFTVPEQRILQIKPLVDEKKTRTIIYLNASDPFFAFYVSDISRYHFGNYQGIHPLSSFNSKIWIKQISDSSFILKADRKGWLSNMFTRISRVNPKLKTGQIFTKDLFTATILRTTPDQTDVLEVRFDFRVSLQDPVVLFLSYNNKRFTEWIFSVSPGGDWELVGDSSDILKEMM